MKTLRTFATFALLPVLSVSACGGDSEFNSSNKRPSIALDSFPEEFAGAQCDVFRRCAGLFYDLVFSTEECRTLVSRQVRDRGFDELELAIEDGTVEYDSEAAATCIGVISERKCEDFDQRGIPECEDAVKGTVPLNGGCEIDAECEGSRICVIEDQCPGTCEERGGAGFECTEDDDCADGFVCSEATRLCAAPKQDGEICGGLVETQCELGLACLGESKEEMRTGTCGPFEELTAGGLGDSCNPDTGTLCESGLSCTVIDLAGPTFSCRAIPASGGTCGLGFPENCPAGEYCDLTPAEIVATGTVQSNCVPLPSSGEPCVDRAPFNDILSQCEAYARCDTSTGNCLAMRHLGETCSRDELCYSGHCPNGGCASVDACQ